MRSLLILTSFFYVQFAFSQSIKLCMEDTRVFPWIIDNEKGAMIYQMHLIGKKLKLNLNLERLPWQRCQIEAQNNNFDGIVGASYNDERGKWGVYPFELDANKLERKYRLHTDSFYLYSQKDSRVSVKDGKIFGLEGESIGVQVGYSIGKNLIDSGYNVKYPATNSLDLLKEFHSKNLKFIILQDHEAILTFTEHPEQKKNIKRINPALKISDQYLLFTKNFYNRKPKIVEAIWKEIEKVRNGKEYNKYLNEMLK